MKVPLWAVNALEMTEEKGGYWLGLTLIANSGAHNPPKRSPLMKPFILHDKIFFFLFQLYP